MNYFICALDKMNLGIPAQQVERIIKTARVQSAVIEKENGEAFISLPALLRQKGISAPHGIVLKTGKPEKIVLLTPKIDKDMQIPEEDIHKLPKTLIGPLCYFRGVHFCDQNAILILDPESTTCVIPETAALAAAGGGAAGDD
jgi:chemotaxis signal transduction protein